MDPSFRPTAPLEGDASFNFRDFLHVFIRKAWVVALFLVVAAAAAALYLYRTPTIYQSRVVMQVEQEEGRAINIDTGAREDLRALEILKTIEQNFRNRSLMVRVIEANNLLTDYEFLPQQDDKFFSREDLLVNHLISNSSARLRRGTRLIDLTFEHENPAYATKIADALVKQYVRQVLEQRLGTSENANEFLVQEANVLKKKLERSEQALQAYKEETASVSLEERQNIVVDKLRELSSRLTQAKAERMKLEADSREIETIKDDPEALLSLSVVASDPTVLGLRQAVTAQEAEIANLSQQYLPKHPKMIAAQSQLRELERAARDAIVQSTPRVMAAYRSALETEKNLEAALSEQETAALDLNRRSIQYNVLTREIESDRALYEAVLLRMKETTLAMGMEPVTLRVVEPALPAYPVKPQKLKVVALAIFGGLGAGLLVVVLLFATDRSVKTVDEAERLFQLPVLGAIPLSRDVQDEKGLLTVSQPDSPVAENFRTLRTALSLLGREEDRRTFIFTSAVPAEGKSFTSANVALAFAQQELNTLLIDGDLRRPAIEKLFFETRGEQGVAEFLTGRAPLDELCRSTGHENLTVLTAGGHVPNPAELLSGKWFGELVTLAAKKFDRVVIDTAPINAVSDTLTMVHHAQSVALVIRAGKTPRNAVSRALEQLRRADARPVGVVLNQLPEGAGLGYYYYYSTPGKYGEVYGAEVGGSAAQK